MNLIPNLLHPPVGADVDQQIIFYKRKRKIFFFLSVALILPEVVIIYLLVTYPKDTILQHFLIATTFAGLFSACLAYRFNRYCGWLREEKKNIIKKQNIEWLKLSN